jgi:hypothetical protein
MNRSHQLDSAGLVQGLSDRANLIYQLAHVISRDPRRMILEDRKQPPHALLQCASKKVFELGPRIFFGADQVFDEVRLNCRNKCKRLTAALGEQPA